MSMSAPQPQGTYSLVVISNEIAVTAGMTPRVHGQLWRAGLIGESVSCDDARHCMRIAVRNALEALQTQLATLDRIQTSMRMTTYLACGPLFTHHTAIADSGSIFLHETLGDRGRPARSAIGVSSLPGGAPVEVELMVALKR